MPYEFPQRLTQNADEDHRRLWDCLFRVVEKLNLAEEENSVLRKEMEAARSEIDALQRALETARPLR